MNYDIEKNENTNIALERTTREFPSVGGSLSDSLKGLGYVANLLNNASSNGFIHGPSSGIETLNNGLGVSVSSKNG